MLKVAFASLLLLHGAIHLLGFAKGFGLAEVAALKQPIGRTAGTLWLLAALLFAAAAVLLFVAPGRWWMAAAPALLLSQALILGAWSDARFGTVANVIVLVPLMVSLLDLAPWSLRSVYQRESARRPPAAAASPADLVTEDDLARLPTVVRQYLRRVGAVGRPHVQGFRARFHGRIRSGPVAPWMDFVAEQRTVFSPPARLFLMTGTRAGIPFDALHLFVGREAIMQVRVASLLDVVDARGPEMNRSETVTFFNDLCLLAPGALVDSPVRWEELDPRSVRATYTRGDQTISAVLTFDASGDLSGWSSGDRYASADGKVYRKVPWSTPVRGWRDGGGVRLLERAETVWGPPEGAYTYGEFVVEELRYDPAPADAGRAR
jgi:hypothetical protein